MVRNKGARATQAHPIATLHYFSVLSTRQRKVPTGFNKQIRCLQQQSLQVILNCKRCRWLSVAVVDIWSFIMARTHFVSNIAIEVLKHFPAGVDRFFPRIVASCLNFSLRWPWKKNRN